jgi:FkbM family methyltransferase
MIIDNYLMRRSYRPTGIVHVGAHRAEELEAYLSLRPDLVVWIEADPDLVGATKARVTSTEDKPKQLVIQALIADEDDRRMEFNRFSNDGGSSSLFRSNETLRARFPGVRETGEVLSLRSRRLDTTLREAGIAPSDIDVLVLDIQGAELMALRGAGEYLKAASFVESEVSTQEIYRDAPLGREIDAFLASQGLRRITHLPVHGDAVYARQNAPPGVAVTEAALRYRAGLRMRIGKALGHLASWKHRLAT